MTKFSRASRPGRGPAFKPALLATTSAAALLLGSVMAQAGQTITANTSSVSNAGVTTSIVITNSIVTGAVTNTGTITPGTTANGGGGVTVTALAVINSSIGGGITNSGTINASGGNTPAHAISSHGGTITGGIINTGSLTASSLSGSATGINITGGTVVGSIANTGRIAVSTSSQNHATGINVVTGLVTGSITNSGTITATSAGFAGGITLFPTSTVTGGVMNSGTITASGANTAIGISVNTSTVTGGISNSGTITVAAGGGGIGLSLFNSTVTGDIVNSGVIIVSAAKGAFAIQDVSNVAGSITNSGRISATSAGSTALAIGVFGSVSGAVANSGTIAANAPKNTAGIVVGNTSTASVIPATVSGGIANSGSIAVTGGAHATGISVNGGSIVSGGIANSGKIAASSPGGVAIGIGLGVTNAGGGAAGATATITGGVMNSGTITASGGKSGIGIAVAGNTRIAAGITNTGTITGNTAAISLAGETGVVNTVTQSAGALVGSVIGSGTANGDVLNVTGGKIVLSGGQSISGFGTYNQSGGTLVFNVTSSTAAGTYPTLSAGTINLAGGTFELAPSGNLFALAAQHTSVFKNAIVADPPLNGSFANVTSAITLFSASLTPDATTANALDATLTLSRTGLAASAQDLTQNLRLGLDAPQVLEQAVQDRLVASGGVLGEDNWRGNGAKAPGLKAPSPIGHADVWVRGFDQFGTAAAPASSAGVGYDVNRAAPLIGGVDWRLDNGIVAGVAATYVATSATFKDGSHTNVSSYQGAAYAGWAGGPWYATGTAVASFNDFGTARLLTPFGLPGAATSSPSGQSYGAYAEAGYHWLLPAAGTSVSVTPYAGIGYIHATIDSFNENGGFGALSVNSADGNSFQTTLGVRATTRIIMGNNAVLVPELRVGWIHEFGDASQSLSASLVGVPGSSFSATGIVFGRDTALIGAGLSMELSPDAKVFVDYDGKLSQRFQEHSISGGLRVKF